MAATELEDEVISGWLSKRMGKNHVRWKKCWFVLDLTNMQSATLAHYEHRTMMRDNVGADRLAPGERQIIPLDSITKVLYAGSGLKFAVHLKTGAAVHLKAISEELAKKWAFGIQSGLELLNVQEEKLQKKKSQKAMRGNGRSHQTPSSLMPELYAGRGITQLTMGRKKKNKGRGRNNTNHMLEEVKIEDNKITEDEGFFDFLPGPPMMLPGPPKEDDEQDNLANQMKEMSIGKSRSGQNSDPKLKQKMKRSSGEDRMKKFQLRMEEGSDIPMNKQNSLAVPNTQRKALTFGGRKKGPGHDIQAIVANKPNSLQVPKNTPPEEIRRNAVLPVLTDRLGAGEGQRQKSPEVEAMLKDTLKFSTSLAHLLFEDLDEEAVEQMVQAMYRVEVESKENVVVQGQEANQFYVVESGKFHVYLTVTFNDEKMRFVAGVPQMIANKGPRTFFGELALLYEQPSNVTVRAVTDGVLWAVSRQAFHNITKASAQKKQIEKIGCLSSLEMIRETLNEQDLVALADAMEYVSYEKDVTMVEKGEFVTHVLFVVSGRVGLFSDLGEDPVSTLGVSDVEGLYESYGALGFLEMTKTAHTLVALAEKTTVLSLNISEVEAIVGSLREALSKKFEESADFKNKVMEEIAIKDKNIGAISPEAAVKMTIQHIKKTEIGTISSGTLFGGGTYLGTIAERVGTQAQPAIDKPWEEAPAILPGIVFEDLKPIKLLGSGNFGQVHLVKNMSDFKNTKLAGTNEKCPEYFALKVLSRDFIVRNGWEQMAQNEKAAMSELSYHAKSQFILRLFHTFADRKNIYFLLELCDGGDLYAIVKRMPGQRLSERHARFYLAGVVKGLEAMHSRTIIYRDLKPENLMLDSSGYLKIGDFGLAKKTLRTFTVCGTPDYMAPETILSKGHDKGVDWWAVGVLVYEIVTGTTPFFGNEPMDIYEAVLAHVTLQIPTSVSLSTKCYDIMDGLLQPKRTKRLGNLREGAQGVVDHSFFHKFKWDQYMRRAMSPPIKKKRPEYKDTNAYDPEFDKENDDESSWEPPVDTRLTITPSFPF